MDYGLAFNILTGVVCSAMGWWLRILWEAQERLTRDLQSVEMRMNENFVRREEHNRAMDQILARFDRLQDRLEHFFNNVKGLH